MLINSSIEHENIHGYSAATSSYGCYIAGSLVLQLEVKETCGFVKSDCMYMGYPTFNFPGYELCVMLGNENAMYRIQSVKCTYLRVTVGDGE